MHGASITGGALPFRGANMADDFRRDDANGVDAEDGDREEQGSPENHGSSDDNEQPPPGGPGC